MTDEMTNTETVAAPSPLADAEGIKPRKGTRVTRPRVTPKAPLAPAKRTDRYVESIGRRKTAVARVRLYTKTGDFLINDRPYAQYFPTLTLQRVVEDALQKMKLTGKFHISVHVRGGGTRAQADAVRLGISRCLVEFNIDFRKRLRRAGYLTRDPRMKERKKPGLRKARRAPQWRKR